MNTISSNMHTVVNRATELSTADAKDVNGGIILIGIILPVMYAGSRTQGDVDNISDITAA